MTVNTYAPESVLEIDATAIAEKIKNGEMTSYDAVSAYIDQIKKVNPVINAMVEDRFTEALEEAREKDNRKTKKGTLYGVPISVKEAFHVAGMKTTGGLINRKHLIMNEDAVVVKKLREAGAIILGKTNTPTLCFCQETDNKLYGRTNNPWDVTRSAGGSSGGEGALIAAGGSAAGIGSDIGGSIRFPSHFNGVVGFKPGKFQVPAGGHFPADKIPLQERMSGMGPMGKSVRDIALMYGIIANEMPAEQTLNNFEVDILPVQKNIPLSERTVEKLKEIEKLLQNSFSVKQSTPPYFEDSAQLWQEIMSIDGAKEVEKLAFSTDRPNVIKAYVKEKIMKRTDNHPYLLWALLGARMFKPSPDRLLEINTIIEQGDERLEDYLEDRLLIFPVYHTGALKHGEVFSEIFSIKKKFLKYMPYIAYANVWGLPSLTIPVGSDENGMPIGVQVISKNGNERAIFQLGEKIEKGL
ncbi:amidase [Virgibacillus doumboii]|uniref:amidase n=1 Tax=Virgibacillus doumboii TaxID=2697503 RepID=UPI0013DEDA0C|nr:amidase [Virgibacillus doumboii]